MEKRHTEKENTMLGNGEEIRILKIYPLDVFNWLSIMRTKHSVGKFLSTLGMTKYPKKGKEKNIHVYFILFTKLNRGSF